jgi:hypothetical protein
VLSLATYLVAAVGMIFVLYAGVIAVLALLAIAYRLRGR